jgi:hypothetical protein
MKKTFITSIALLILFAVSQVTADEKEDKEKKVYRKSGTLAAATTSRNGSVDAWNDTDPSGKEKQPLDGSISKVGEGKWELRLFNNSEDPVQATAAVMQFDKLEKQIKRDVFSYTVPGKQSITQSVSGLATTSSCKLELLDWKSFAKVEPTAAPTAVVVILPPKKKR